MRNSIPLVSLFSVVVGSVAYGAAAKPDLTVQIQTPANAQVYTAGTYAVTVSNIGNKDADGSAVTIQLPTTATSPTTYIMGTLSAIDGRCRIVGTALSCGLGRISARNSTIVRFGFTVPLAMKALTLSAIASTSTQEASTTNNSALKTLQLAHPALPITSGFTASNSHCTGTGLSSYFECKLFPSSLSSHTTRLNSDGTITFDVADYAGYWQQTTPDRLTFQYVDTNGAVVANFQGFAVDGSCFEGITTFLPNSNYVSPYRVCITAY